ncbi:MAG: hypothetical protein KBE04_15140 [Phycisphaerae bacterium]|nr:hypothetical protein [Phycisphaerae bacterium]
MKARVLLDHAQAPITGREVRLVALWAAGLLLLYGLGGGFGVHLLKGYKAQTARFRHDWVQAAQIGPSAGPSEGTLPGGTGPVDVNVGIYIDRIGEFSPRENRWTAEFDLWFSWTGDPVRPGETFEVVDGQVERQEKVASTSEGGRHVERYRVRARILKFIDASRFPFCDEELAVQIEEGIGGAGALRYVADTRKSGIDPQAVRRFLRITRSAALVKEHTRGADRIAHSRFIYAMLVSPVGVGFYVKMFQGLFASVAVACVAFSIRPVHIASRLSLGIGAFFAVMGNQISLGTVLLVSDRLSLADMVTGVGLATIFLTLVESAISLYLLVSKGREQVARLLDRTSLVVLLLAYGTVNVLLPLAAGP